LVRRQYLRLLLKEPELPRQHPDDLVRRAIDDEGLAQNARSAAEAALPKVVADYDNVGLTGLTIVGTKRSTLNSTHTEY